MYLGVPFSSKLDRVANYVDYTVVSLCMYLLVYNIEEIISTKIVRM